MKARLWIGVSVVAAALQVGAIGAQTASSPRLPVLGGVVGRVSYCPEAVTDQPYSLVKTTTTVRTLGDGTKLTSGFEQHEMRDAEGRTRDESYFKRDGKSQLGSVNLFDPLARTETILFVRTKTANVRSCQERAPQTPEQQQSRAEALARLRAEHAASAAKNTAAGTPNARPVSDEKVETLTPQTVAGVYATGMRFTQIIPVGVQGNDREIRVVSETWTSPDLKILVGRTMDDPRTEKMTMVVSDLERSDPAPALFQVPEGYKVVDVPSPHAAGAP